MLQNNLQTDLGILIKLNKPWIDSVLKNTMALTNDKILEWSKFKLFAENNINTDKKNSFLSKDTMVNPFPNDKF